MNEPQPHACIGRKAILKDIGSGLLLFFGLALIFVPVATLTAAFPETFRLEPMSIGGLILTGFIVAYAVAFYVGVPIFVTILLIRDIFRVIKDQDPVFWYKRWYRRLAVTAVLVILAMIAAGLSPDDRATSQPKTLRYTYFTHAIAAVRQFFVPSGFSTALFAGNGTKTRLLFALAAIECEVPAGCAGCPVVGVVTAATL